MPVEASQRPACTRHVAQLLCTRRQLLVLITSEMTRSESLPFPTIEARQSTAKERMTFSVEERRLMSRGSEPSSIISRQLDSADNKRQVIANH